MTDGTERPEDALRRIARDNIDLQARYDGLQVIWRDYFADVFSEVEQEASELKARCGRLDSENYALMSALHDIAQNSIEADMVRGAVAAICNTTSGPFFLQTNPLA